MPTTKPDVVYRYAGPKKPRKAPFAFAPARDLTARDVARLNSSEIREITGGDRPLYVKAGKDAPAAEPPAAPSKPATTPKE